MGALVCAWLVAQCMHAFHIYSYAYGATLCMEASQRYLNTIQQAIAHAHMRCPCAYGIGNRLIRVLGNIRVLGRTIATG